MIRTLLLLVCSLLTPACFASAAPGKAMKPGNIVDARARSAQEQSKLFTVPDGFSLELVASEATGLPKPVSIAFDDRGRLWSSTAVEYPRDRNADIWKQPGRDRVVVIDRPHLPSPQPVRTFADGLVMPLSVLPHGHGVFVAQGPEILFLDDRNQDGRADQRRVLLKGFGVQDTHTLPHQLVRVPGGRIAFSQGVLNSGTIMDANGRSHPFHQTIIASVTPQGTDLRYLGAGLNNIWAWAQDRLGRVFIHEANDLGYSFVPFEEDSSYPSFFDTRLHPAAPLHPPTAEGLNLGGTGFSGIAICDDRSGSFPAAWRGRFLVANPILGRIHVVSGSPQPDGVWRFEKQEDLVTCDDPMFRPVAITFGPDGCLYIVDWYNRIISHNEVARDHPGRDKVHGRIWRVRHRSQSRDDVVDYTKAPIDRLPAALNSDSTWAMRAAWHQIALRQDKSVVPDLVALLRNPQTLPDVQIHALWSLEELGHFDAGLWARLLARPSADVRREAVRALTTLAVPQAEAGPLLHTLAQESAWTVRYEVLRYFRRAAGPVAPQHLAWLRAWSASTATTNEVPGWKGPHLALDGSYQRAFQDFLFMLAETKTQLPVVVESKWNGVLATQSGAADPRAVDERIAAVKAALPTADTAEGRMLTESLCLGCHSVGAKGVGFAPPLDGSASRDVDNLLTAMVNPDAAMENVFRNYRIETKDGRTVEGFRYSETRQAITLLLMGGESYTVPIRDIAAAGFIEGRSVMPDLTAGLSTAQVASLATYLRSLK